MKSRCNEEQAKLRQVFVEDLWDENGSDLQHQHTVASGASDDRSLLERSQLPTESGGNSQTLDGFSQGPC